jgi:tetratricopeptide (TPR) repeat protein
LFLALVRKAALYAGLFALAAPVCAAQSTSKVNLDTSETLFSVMTALNYCGYDQDLNIPEPLRAQIRGEVGKNVQASEAAIDDANQLCRFYSDHRTGDGSRDLAQYVSLALYLGEAPAFIPKVKEADLPPDASYVLGFAPLLKNFYDKAALHQVWLRHRDQYAALVERYHQPVAKMLFDTDIYLKLPLSGYLGRQFTVYLEPMGAAGQANARNYASDYYVVLTPSESSLKIDQIRHTYLHFVLDPLAMKRSTTMKRLEPLLDVVKTSPMDESFKNDITLLVTESMVRAIEIRTLAAGKRPEPERNQDVDKAVAEGYILTRYFYDALAKFEKDPVGLRDAYPDLLYGIDVGREMKRANETQFATKASPEVLAASRPQQALLRLAEQKLSISDPAAAQKLAQQALDEKREDSGRALFILARAAIMTRDLEGARGYFERTLQVAREPKLLAWSHIYLGRIFDLQEERETALEQYRAALTAGDPSPEIKTAAERGMTQPYQPPASPQQ